MMALKSQPTFQPTAHWIASVVMPMAARNAPLCRPCLITVFLRIKIQRRLDLGARPAGYVPAVNVNPVATQASPPKK